MLSHIKFINLNLKFNYTNMLLTYLFINLIPDHIFRLLSISSDYIQKSSEDMQECLQCIIPEAELLRHKICTP